MVSLLLLLSVSTLLLSLGATAPDYVQTKNGLVMGEAYENHRTFFGIPFGQAPVGDLRFASPVPASSWSPDTWNATEVPAACPGTIQSAFSILPAFEIDEDCLYLNVYTPSKERLSKPLPVMFYIYGGAFLLGDGYELGLYDGSYIASTRDVIVVTHNYRLGPFGFLVTEEGAEGNYGLEDQRLALQWTIDNIASFGGDPKQITIFGESAGAMSMGAHITSPLSRGMFQRAIFQSNALGLKFRTKSQAVEVSNRLATLVDCTPGDLVCLRSVGWRKLAFIHLPVFPAGVDFLIGDILPWSPTIDNRNLFRNPIESFRMGDFADIPSIWGVNKDEMVLFQGLLELGVGAIGRIIGRNLTLDIGPIAYNLILDLMFKEDSEKVKEVYPASLRENNLPQLASLLSEYVFKCSSRFAALSMSSMGQSPIYTYQFSHVPEWFPLLERLNRMCFTEFSCHAMELPYVFHSEKLSVIPVSGKFTPGEEQMSQTMMDFWTSFAAGEINAQNPPIQWDLFSTGKQNMMDISPTFFMNTWDAKTCDFWDSIGYKY